MKKVRDEPRPDKEKKPRPDPGEPRVDPDPPVYIIIQDTWPVPPPPLPIPPPYEEYYYIESYDEPASTNLEVASMLLTSATLVWNASYLRTGDSNAFVATTGIFTGLSSLAMAFSDQARYPILNFLLGTTQIVFSIANLSNSLERTDSFEEDDYYSDSYYSSTPTNGISYSYSF